MTINSVVESSLVLAFLLGEIEDSPLSARLQGALMTTINIAEVAQRYAREGHSREAVADIIADLPVISVSPDLALAIDAGTMIAATAKRGLSLADRFCLALARREGAVAVTADRAWAQIANAVGVSVETIR